MKLNVDSIGNIEIKGVIKTIEDVENIKQAIENYIKGDTVKLTIIDSFAMPSALIGYLIKLHSLQKKNIILKIGDDNLYELMQDLNLDKEFNVQKV
jgi:hypothetical protein